MIEIIDFCKHKNQTIYFHYLEYNAIAGIDYLRILLELYEKAQLSNI